MNRKYEMYECDMTMTSGDNDLLEYPAQFACNFSDEVKDRKGINFETLENYRKRI